MRNYVWNWSLSLQTPLLSNPPHMKGGRTDKNAHPHMDFDNRIALVHNGTINNAMELRKELQDMGVEFRSETDSEVGEVEVEVEVERYLRNRNGGILYLIDRTWWKAKWDMKRTSLSFLLPKKCYFGPIWCYSPFCPPPPSLKPNDSLKWRGL